MRSFCRKTYVHKIPRFGGGGVLGFLGFFGGGGGSADFIFMGAGIFLILSFQREFFLTPVDGQRYPNTQPRNEQQP